MSYLAFPLAISRLPLPLSLAISRLSRSLSLAISFSSTHFISPPSGLRMNVATINNLKASYTLANICQGHVRLHYLVIIWARKQILVYTTPMKADSGFPTVLVLVLLLAVAVVG